MIALLIVAVGIGSYYLYLLLGPSSSNKTANSDMERLFQITKDGGGAVVSEIVDYTSADAEPGKTIKIKGEFQSGDPAQKDINGISYVYVIGVLREDNSLAKIWLTQAEYEKVKDLIAWEKGSVAPGQPVLITIARDSISIEKSEP